MTVINADRTKKTTNVWRCKNKRMGLSLTHRASNFFIRRHGTVVPQPGQTLDLPRPTDLDIVFPLCL